MHALQEALMSSFTAKLDPNAVAVRQLMSAQIATMEQDLKDRKAESIEKYEAMLRNAIERDAPQSVITAYEKLLAQTVAV